MALQFDMSKGNALQYALDQERMASLGTNIGQGIGLLGSVVFPKQGEGFLEKLKEAKENIFKKSMPEEPTPDSSVGLKILPNEASYYSNSPLDDISITMAPELNPIERALNQELYGGQPMFSPSPFGVGGMGVDFLNPFATQR